MKHNYEFCHVSNHQDATTFSFINPFNSALHVLGDKFADPQEQILTIYSFWYNAPTLLPTGAAVEMELVPSQPKAVYTVKKCS